MIYATAQEELWVGSFGDDYVDRNDSGALLAPKLVLLTRILARTHGVRSILEFGANIGLNLIAVKSVLPGAELKAVEINEKAFRKLRRIQGVDAQLGSILSYGGDAVAILHSERSLIHISPDEIQRAYETLYRAARRYVVFNRIL